MNFIIDENTDIYDIKIFNTVIQLAYYNDDDNFIAERKGIKLGSNNYSRCIIIKLNNNIDVFLPIIMNKDHEKNYDKQLKVTQSELHMNQLTENFIERFNKKNKFFEKNKFIVNYKLLEKILNIEDKKYTHYEIIDYLLKCNYLVIFKDYDNSDVPHLHLSNKFWIDITLLQKIINYFNKGKLIISMTNDYKINDYHHAHYDEFIKIKLLSNSKIIKNNYFIFSTLLDFNNKRDRTKKYKILEYDDIIQNISSKIHRISDDLTVIISIQDNTKYLIVEEINEDTIIENLIIFENKKEEPRLYIDL